MASEGSAALGLVRGADVTAPETHWSVVQAAGDATSPRHADALEEVCRRYWYPLYAFARRSGRPPEDAADSAQAFFAGFLERNGAARADPARGRFRNYLLTSFRNHLINEHDHACAARRGGGQTPISFDIASAEDRFSVEPAEATSPDWTFDRAWAMATLERALARLRVEYATAGKADLHDQLRALLWDERSEETYKQLGARVGLSEAAVKMAVLRLRKRCRNALLEEVTETVAGLQDVEAELSDLLAAIRS